MFAKTSTFVCVVVGAMLSAVPAAAQSGTEPEGASTSPAGPDGVDSVTLPKGRVLLDAYLEINLSLAATFDPVSLSPDVWYGATDDITVGLVHSAVGSSGFIGDTGQSLCLVGDLCGDVYHNVGIDGRYKLKTGPLAYAAE